MSTHPESATFQAMPTDDPIASPPAQAAPTPEPIPFPAPAPKTGRAVSNPINGKLGGNRPGARHADKITCPPEALEAAVNATAIHVMKGGSPLRKGLHLGPVTEKDREYIARFAGMTADEFAQRLSAKMRTLADMTADRIHQHLLADNFKPSDLTWLMTTMADRIQKLEGRNQINNAAVNVQINNFGPRTREEVIAALTGQLPDVPPTPQPQLVPASSPDLSTTATPITLEVITTPASPDPSPESHDAKTPSN